MAEAYFSSRSEPRAWRPEACRTSLARITALLTRHLDDPAPSQVAELEAEVRALREQDTWARLILDNATDIDRFRDYRSVEEVIVNFERDLRSKLAKSIHSELKLLNLPMLHDLREDFERKARELGFEPNTLLTSPYLDRLST